MNRKNFLKNILLGIPAVADIGSFEEQKQAESLPKTHRCSISHGKIKDVYLVPSEQAETVLSKYEDKVYITRQIARYNKRFIEELDERIFQVLNKKSKYA